MPSYDEARIKAALREYGENWRDQISLAKHLAPLMESARREGYEEAMEEVRFKDALNDEFGD